MPELLLYLLKVNVALLLFYLAYYLVLRKLTFYTLNRLFLAFGIVFSAIYPLIDVSGLFQSKEQIAAAYLVTIPAWAYAPPAAATTPEAFDYWQLPVYLFGLGVSAMLLRFILQLVSLYKIHLASVRAAHKGIRFREVSGISEAFSFWQTIYLNPSQHKTSELESILRHEQVHVKGWHTLDVLLAELNTVFCWFNPGVWPLKKAIKENLEFIADQNVVSAGVDRKMYQYLLLKVTGPSEPQIANQFNFPSLKRRIAMMNKKPTSKANQLKLLIMLPLVTFLLFAFRDVTQNTESPGKKKASVTNDQVQAQEILPLLEEQEAFLKRNPGVKKIAWISSDTDKIVIYLKSGSAEMYDLNNKGSVEVARNKYGELPALPPPPKPPVPVKEGLPPPPPVRIESPAKQKNSPGASLVKARESGSSVQQQNIPSIKASNIITGSAQDSLVYFVDGKRMPAASIKNIDPKKIEKIDVVKGEKAKELADGEQVKGVINITTTSNTRSNKHQKGTNVEAKVLAGGNLSKTLDTLPQNAVYILDDKEVSLERIKQLRPDDIKAVSVMKNSEKMVQKYGPKASNGVIIVYTKSRS